MNTASGRKSIARRKHQCCLPEAGHVPAKGCPIKGGEAGKGNRRCPSQSIARRNKESQSDDRRAHRSRACTCGGRPVEASRGEQNHTFANQSAAVERFSASGRKSIARQKQMRGGVLLVVLVMTAFLLGIAMLMYEGSDKSYRQLSAVYRDAQGAIYAASALEAVSSLMSMIDDSYDGADSLWTIIPPIPVTGGFVTVTVQPADDRLPVNMLANPDDNLSKRAEEAFYEVFRNAELDDELWRTIKDLVSPEDSIAMTNNIDGLVLNEGGSSYTAKRGPISSLAELRIIPSLRRDYRTMADYICAGDIAGHININFASEEIIQAFLPELANYAADIVQAREGTPFKTKDELYAFLGPSAQSDYIAALPYFDVKSNAYYVRIEIDLGQGVQYYHALYKRNGRRINLVSYIEGGIMDYF